MKKSVLAAVLVVAFAGSALAGANPTPVTSSAEPSRDPGAELDYRSFTPEQVRTRLKDACMYQRAQSAAVTDALAPGCRCYSERLIAAMTEAEIDSWKTTRRFDTATKAKAEAALAACVGQ